MPWYNDLRPLEDHKERDYALVFPQMTDPERKRTISNLIRLKKGLNSDVPQKKSDDSLLLCSWNIKEFGHLTKRLPETYFYIAEIIEKFDLIAIQEIKSQLKDLEIIMRLLGKNWGYIITDITEGTAGNSERFGYIYDKRKVVPSGLSGEIVLWEDLTENSDIKQLKRTPAITGFRAGWKSFAIVNVHLHPGNKEDDQKHRKEEVDLLIKAIEHKYKNSRLWNENLILLGDTNLYQNNDEIVHLFTNARFREADGLVDQPTNVSESEVYDRIFLRVNDFFKLKRGTDGKEKGDVFEMFDYVFNEDDPYRPVMLEHKENPDTLDSPSDFQKYFDRFWKRNQLSDHNPIWIEIEIDSSYDFLEKKLSVFT